MAARELFRAVDSQMLTQRRGTCVRLGMFDVEELRTQASEEFVMMSLSSKTPREIMAKTQVQRNESLEIYVNKDMAACLPGHLYCLRSGTCKICQ